MVFACKKCRKTFRKDMDAFEEADEYCPHCDNHYILPAVTANKPAITMIEVPTDEPLDSRCAQKNPFGPASALDK